MGRSLVAFARHLAEMPPFVSFTTPAGLVTSSSGQAAFRQMHPAIAGRFSGLAAKIDASGTDCSVRLHVNGADASQVVAFPDATAGIFSDATHSDAVAAGDNVRLRFEIDAEETLPVIDFVRTLFRPDGGLHAGLYDQNFSSTIAASAGAKYIPIGGAGPLLLPIAYARHLIRAPGTLRRVGVYVFGNTHTANTVIRSNINGADGNIVITIPALSTGWFEDTTHTDTLADGDLACLSVSFSSPNAAKQIQFATIASTIVNSGPANDLFASFSSNSLPRTRAASATPTYYAITGFPHGQGTESQVAIPHGFRGEASRLRINIDANTYTSPATLRFRKGGADGALTATIGAGATGWIEDDDHADAFASDDACSFSITGGGSGSISIASFGLTERDMATRPTGQVIFL